MARTYLLLKRIDIDGRIIQMCNKCSGNAINHDHKGLENSPIEVDIDEDLAPSEPKISSLIVLNMVLDFLHKTGATSAENIKYLEDTNERIESASVEEQDVIKEDLMKFLNKVAEKLKEEVDE
jgi:hypothetical protein